MEIKKGYYWVRLITQYGGLKPELEKDKNIIIGKFDGRKGEDILSWDVIGSDEIFSTYKKGKKMYVGETMVIPIKRIKEIKNVS